MPVYASFDFDSPRDYLTRGRRYKTLPSKSRDSIFSIVGDGGCEITCQWKKCPHLHGRDWTRHEEPDAEPSPDYALPPMSDARAAADAYDEHKATLAAHLHAGNDAFALHRTVNGGWIVDDAVEDASILAAFTNTDDLLAGLPALLGEASPVEESMTDEAKRLGCPADCRAMIVDTIRDMKMRGGFKW